MMKFNLKFFWPMVVLLSASCSRQLKYSKEELFSKALRADASVKFIIPRGINEGINCKDYSDGCLAGHTVQMKGLDFIAVEFATEEQARRAAKKYRGYYTRNWLFDDVSGEPTLERFVTDSLEAKKP
jgi:xanthine dehydrogenase molybdopterin-binding subunit B